MTAKESCLVDLSIDDDLVKSKFIVENTKEKLTQQEQLMSLLGSIKVEDLSSNE